VLTDTREAPRERQNSNVDAQGARLRHERAVPTHDQGDRKPRLRRAQCGDDVEKAPLGTTERADGS
jgi:hypothetical protein